MSTLYTDNFDRANNTDLGADWTVITSMVRFGIVSNTAQPSDLTGSDDGEYVNAITDQGDSYAQGNVSNTITTADGNYNGVGVGIRASTSAESFYAAITVNDRVKLFLMNGGTASLLGTFLTTWADGDLLYIEAQGSSLVVKVAGTTQITASNSTLTSGRFCVTHGTSAGASTAQVDNFEGGDFAAAATGWGPLLALQNNRLVQAG